MSEALYEVSGLRFWSEDEIFLRRQIEDRLVHEITTWLPLANPAWRSIRCEGPTLIPVGELNPEYGVKHVFQTQHEALGDKLVMRAETTATTYKFAERIMELDPKVYKPPLCVYQTGKSYRRELSDGANWGKLRALEFWQLEFQCIYSDDTKFPYMDRLVPYAAEVVGKVTNKPYRVIDSDRLPSYSTKTVDIEVYADRDRPFEVASCSLRNDFREGYTVFEMAFGLDRLTTLANLP